MHGKDKEECIFCKIRDRQISALIVYEDKDTMAFLDINPVNLGHTLVVPKEHIDSFLNAKNDTLTSVTLTTQRVAAGIKKSLNADGINIIINNGKAAGQVIFHLHLHVIPRLQTDGLKHWKGKSNIPEKDLHAIAEKIKKALTP